MQHSVERFNGPRQLRNGLAVAVASLVLAGCASGVTTPTASSFTSQSARAIVTDARSAMTAAGTVSASGGGSGMLSGGAAATISEADYTGSTSGSQLEKITSGGATPDGTAWTVDVDGALYMDANAEFWSSQMDMPSTVSAAVASRWVQIARDSTVYAPVAADLTMSSLTHDMFDAKRYHKSRIHTVDGVPAIAITYSNGGIDSGSAVCYVATTGAHLPVAVDIGGLTLHLRSWGKTTPVTAPQGSVPLASLLPSAPSSGLADA